jgi:integrase
MTGPQNIKTFRTKRDAEDLARRTEDAMVRGVHIAPATGMYVFHDLRHEAIGHSAEAGLSDLEVSAISGHKSMQMLKHDTHLRAEDLVEKLDLLQSRKVR